MDGIFLRKKFNIWLFLLFVCGLLFIGLYIFLNIVDPEATSKLLSFLIVGILICLVVIPSWLLNFGAFLHIDIDGKTIKAKYHWFGKINCNLSDVTFASARINTLMIQLKDGKCHTIMGITNCWELASIIRQNMFFEAPEQPEMLMERLNKLKSDRKKNIIFACFCYALLFVNIFVTVFLTGERELHEFGQNDWIVFAIMGAIGIATVLATFFFAQKTGKTNVPIDQLQYTIRRTIVETKPLLPGFIIAVYTDENYTGRITVYGYPHQNDVYYSVQNFDSVEYKLVHVYSSELYESQAALKEELEELIDITEKVLQN